MNELVRLRRSNRLWKALCLMLGGAAVFLCLRGLRAKGPRVLQMPDGASASLGEELEEELARAGYAERVRLLQQLGTTEAEASIQEALSSGNAERKQAALEAMGSMSTPGSIEAMVRALDDRDVWGQAASQLAELGGRQAARALVDRYGRATPEERLSLIDKIAAIHDPAGQQVLVSALRGRDVDLAEKAAMSLAVYSADDPNIQSQLLSLLGSGQNANTRLSYAVASAISEENSRLYRVNKTLVDSIIESHGPEETEDLDTSELDEEEEGCVCEEEGDSAGEDEEGDGGEGGDED